MWKVGVKIPLYFEVKSILVLSTSPRRPKRARVSLSLAHKSFYQTYTNIFSKFTQIFSSNPNKSFSQTETKRCQTHTNLFIKLKLFFLLQTQTNLFIKLTQIFLSNSHKSCCQIHTHFQFIKNVFPYYVLNKAATAFHQTFTFLSRSHKYIFHIQPIFFILTQIFVIKLKQIFFVKQKQISNCSC